VCEIFFSSVSKQHVKPIGFQDPRRMGEILYALSHVLYRVFASSAAGGFLLLQAFGGNSYLLGIELHRGQDIG